MWLCVCVYWLTNIVIYNNRCWIDRSIVCSMYVCLMETLRINVWSWLIVIIAITITYINRVSLDLDGKCGSLQLVSGIINHQFPMDSDQDQWRVRVRVIDQFNNVHWWHRHTHINGTNGNAAIILLQLIDRTYYCNHLTLLIINH